MPGATADSVGKQFGLRDLASIEDVQLTQIDENAAHITLLLHKGAWFIAFDLRYNRARVLEYLATVDEFLATARDALERGRLRPFVENLLAGVEHLARCILLVHPDEDLLKKNSSHKLVKTRFNQHSRFGNVDTKFSQLLNRLWELRNPARYMTGDLSLTPSEAQTLLRSAEEMRKAAEDQLPPRSRISLSG